ncbi:MAG TPA: hypothetical protein DDX85_00425 [Nitrospiraceae bacterium]|nr:hypothetical protein [Nitrospiraceae bacterium]
MANKIEKELSQKYCRRFGQIAVERGYVTSEQLKQAVSEQIDDDMAGRPHRLIGRIFLDNERMTPQQIELVLNELFQTERE